jgi:hypothetical protein
MQLVQPSHQAQIFGTLGTGFVVVSAAAHAQKRPLPPHTQSAGIAHQRQAFSAYRPSCPDFFLSQSSSIVG